MKIAKKLNPRQLKFVAEYLVDLNATQAAIRAGYSKKTSRQMGAQNLSKLNIREKIDEQIDLALDGGRAKLKLRVQLELEQLAFSRFSDYMDEDCKEIDLKAIKDHGSIKEVAIDERHGDRGYSKNIKLKLHDKNQSLQALGKISGLIQDKVELTGPISITFGAEEANL